MIDIFLSTQNGRRRRNEEKQIKCASEDEELERSTINSSSKSWTRTRGSDLNIFKIYDALFPSCVEEPSDYRAILTRVRSRIQRNHEQVTLVSKRKTFIWFIWNVWTNEHLQDSQHMVRTGWNDDRISRETWTLYSEMNELFTFVYQ